MVDRESNVTQSKIERRGLLRMTAPLAAGALLVWRLVSITEGAAAGETLWIAQFWPVVLLLWCLDGYSRRALRIRFGWIDVAAWLLVGGHVVSALVVVATVGDRRSALNMLWEWVALGLTFFMLRQMIDTSRERASLMLVIVATALSLSGLGIWQHFVWYREKISEYAALQDERAELERNRPPDHSPAASEWGRRYGRVQGDYARLAIPWEGQGRILWEQRLQQSKEPFGMFALANTLAGLLASSLVLLIGVLIRTTREGATRGGAAWLAAGTGWCLCGGMAYCLLLTKSRTAFVGFGAGTILWCLHLWISRSVERKRFLKWAGLGLLAVVGLVSAAWSLGGLDRLVLSESSKSMQYRLEYWITTYRVISESPRHFLVGVGPGNLRPHYLRHKLPQSSEEVADPHNMLLDVWANGGVLALAGLLGLCAAGFRPLLRIDSGNFPQQQPAEPRRVVGSGSERLFAPLVSGAGLGFCVAFFAGGGEDLRLPALLLGWLFAVAAIGGLFSRYVLTATASSAACVALAVHLLGAGGIAMPAICQTLLMLVAMISADEGKSRIREISSPWAIKGIGLIGMALYLGCWFSATAPVLSREALMASGNFSYFNERNPARSEAAYQRAAQADSFSAEPFERLSRLSLQQWSTSNDAEQFERCVEWQRRALERNPMNVNGYRALADAYMQRYKRTKTPEAALAAAESLTVAAALYPNNGGLQADLAEAMHAAGRNTEARFAARNALELHDGNVRAGHVDKVLSETQLARLRAIESKALLPDERAEAN